MEDVSVVVTTTKEDGVPNTSNFDKVKFDYAKDYEV